MSANKKILVLGAGYVAKPCVDYLLRRPENSVTVACRGVEAAEELIHTLEHGKDRAHATSLDVKDAEKLLQAVSEHDVVISLIPYTYHPLVIEAAIKARKHFCSTSYVSAVMETYHQKAQEAGITVLNEIGVDPGIDHLYAMKTIHEVHENGGKIRSFISFCGGLPAPEASNNPFGYKFSWSARGVLMAAGNTAKYLEGGKVVEIPASKLLSEGTKEIPIYPAFAFEGYPNRDSTGYGAKYGIEEAQTILRGTLRYKGCPALIKALVDVGFLNDDDKDYLKADGAEIAWKDVLASMLGTANDEESLKAAVAAKAGLTESNKKRILDGFRWLGLFSSSPAPRKRSLLDSLAFTMADKMKYLPGERDMLMLQHRFEIEKADGSLETRTSTMVEYGIPNGATAMSRTVGIPCAIAVQLILDGKITRTGVLAPMTPDIYVPIIDLLEKENISCKEEILQ